MPTIQARSKYYLLSVLGALVVAGGVLALSPPSQAQEEAPITVDKECTPNPVQVGQQITCTIDVVPAPILAPTIVVVKDTLPDSVTVTGATQQRFLNDSLSGTAACGVSGNTVTCPPEVVEGPLLSLEGKTVQVTIDALAEQCDTSTNTAEVTDVIHNNTFTSTAEFTVVGCEGPGGGDAGGGSGGSGGGGGGGGAAPITQEVVQESEAGEFDQNVEVS